MDVYEKIQIKSNIDNTTPQMPATVAEMVTYEDNKNSEEVRADLEKAIADINNNSLNKNSIQFIPGRNHFGEMVTTYIDYLGTPHEFTNGDFIDYFSDFERLTNESIEEIYNVGEFEIGTPGQVWGVKDDESAGWVDQKGGEIPEGVVTSSTMDNNTVWLGTKAEYNALDEAVKSTKDLFITTDEPYAEMKDNASGGIDITIGDKTETLAKQNDILSMLRVSSITVRVSGNSSTPINAPSIDGYSFVCWTGVSSTGFIGAPYISNHNAQSATIWDSRSTTDTNLSYNAYALFMRS